MEQDRQMAIDLIKEAVSAGLRRFKACEVLEIDVRTLQMLGVVPSFSDDNPYSESLFRTLKYTPAYPNKPFESLEVARKWVHGFVQWYNHEHRHSAIRYVILDQRHRGMDGELLKQREAVYEMARQRNPERWSGNTRNWDPVTEVWLNPPKENQAGKPQGLKAA